MWEVCEEWKKTMRDKNFDRLWEMQRIRRKWSMLGKLPEMERLTNVEKEVVEEVRKREKKKTPAKWRKKLIGRARGILRTWIESMEKQCKIPVAGEMGRLRKERGKMR
jgi:GTP1/Obg family GTP-binding protein